MKQLLSIDLFFIEREKWMELSPKGATPSARAKHSFVQIREKEYLLIGGEDNKDNNSQDILIYHPGLFFINVFEFFKLFLISIAVL